MAEALAYKGILISITNSRRLLDLCVVFSHEDTTVYYIQTALMFINVYMLHAIWLVCYIHRPCPLIFIPYCA